MPNVGIRISFMENSSAPPGHIVLLAILFEGSLAIVAVLLGWLLGYDPLVHVHWTWLVAAWGTAATLPPLAMMFWCSRTRWAPCRSLTRLVRKLILPWFARATLLDLALVSISAGVGEELLFRGFLQAAIADWTNPWIALAIASLLFGLAHFITPMYAVLATLLGAYLGGLWLACDNLLAPIVTHALYDFLALVYLLRRPRRVRSQTPP
jgi:membrane protease YdiL (CAAX protease family)